MKKIKRDVPCLTLVSFIYMRRRGGGGSETDRQRWKKKRRAVETQTDRCGRKESGRDRDRQAAE